MNFVMAKPPQYTAHQQTQRWMEAGTFEDMLHDLRALLKFVKGKRNNLLCFTNRPGG
jgi:hypothetical protein